MKTEIYSRAEPGVLLHVILRISDFGDDTRGNIGAPSEPLQVSMISARAGASFRAHKHLPKKTLNEHVTQESWVVVKGTVAVAYYDIDGRMLDSTVLETGDCSITYRGGHSYSTTDGALVYEHKTGPYHGQEADKVFI